MLGFSTRSALGRNAHDAPYEHRDNDGCTYANDTIRALWAPSVDSRTKKGVPAALSGTPFVWR